MSGAPSKNSGYKWAIGALSLLSVILLIGIFHTGFMNKQLATLAVIQKEHPFIDPAQALYDKDDLIINVTPLRDELEALGRQDPNLTIYFEMLNTGANISINNLASFWPASLMKIPVAMAVMKRVQDGVWELDDELLLLERDKDDKYGALYLQPANTAFSVDALLEEMLINSDNTARTIFMRKLDPLEIQDVLEHLGLEDIFGTDQEVRAKKYSVFWRSLYAASFLNAENSEKLIEIMTRSSAQDYLRKGIPSSVPFSHKIGWADNVYADSGIVYVPGRPYILTVMMSGRDASQAETLMGNISKRVYTYVASY
jgi:beta-lactamase class A